MFKSINPHTLDVIETYGEFDESRIKLLLETAELTYDGWRKTSYRDRADLLNNTSKILKKDKQKYAEMMTLEMGKPVSQAISEIEKCAWVCEYYAEHGDQFLRDEAIKSDAQKSYVTYEPLGAILAVMPWNFPYWQVFRFLAPTIMAGNVAIVKHAPNVQGTALLIEELMAEAGFPRGVYQNLLVEVDKMPDIISHSVIKAVTLTGSGRAGSSVASLAGKSLKKTVLELGGSNAFIVLDDADLDLAVEKGVFARMQNNGQSCIAAKRFFIHQSVYEDYLDRFKKKLTEYKLADPLLENTLLGPVARVDLAENLDRQVRLSIEQGAELEYGGTRKNAHFEPTLLTNIREGMPAFDEELFGPVAAFAKIDNLDDAIDKSNLSDYGLGVSIFTDDIEKSLKSISRIEDGAVFFNELVKSDPRLPFGGTKKSGYGRELGPQGIREFVNIKTIYIA